MVTRRLTDAARCEAAARGSSSASVSVWAGGPSRICVRVHGEIRTDVDQLAGGDLGPAGVLVHPLGGDDDRGAVCELTGAHADAATGAGMLEMARLAAGAARRALEHEKIVGVGIAQRPQILAGDEDEVQ